MFTSSRLDLRIQPLALPLHPKRQIRLAKNARRLPVGCFNSHRQTSKASKNLQEVLASAANCRKRLDTLIDSWRSLRLGDLRLSYSKANSKLRETFQSCNESQVGFCYPVTVKSMRIFPYKNCQRVKGPISETRHASKKSRLGMKI